MVKSQQVFLSALVAEGFVVKFGRIMYDGGAIREKGVDVKLSVDLEIGAADDIYDTAIVMSSDTDLIPAIEVALGRFGELVALEGEVADLSERLEARKLVDRAKGILMDEHGMTEQLAWRFIQVQAMSQRRRVSQIAQSVVDRVLAP